MSTEELFKDTESISEDLLTQVSFLCQESISIEEDIVILEEKLKEKKKELENIQRNLIPSIFNSVGLSEIKLVSGETVEVKDKIKANIKNDDLILAYRNMINEEGGDEEAQRKIDSLFKSETILENVSDKVLDFLLDNDIPYNNKRSIHYQTLNKYCRERLEMGKEIPEGISVFQYQETKIK